MKLRCVLSLLLVHPLLADADLINLSPAKDNTIFEPGGLSNGAGDDLFAGNTFQPSGTDTTRALVQFDLSSIPAGSVINSVSLVLNLNRSNRAGTLGFSLHQLTSDWGEGTSNSSVLGGGMGAAATPGDATWVDAFTGGAAWTTVGGDFNPTASATLAVDATLGLKTWTSTPELVADAQSWIDTPALNFGWILLADETITPSAKRFDSREGSSPPLLSIDYTAIPEPTSMLLTLLGGAALLFAARQRP